MTAESRIPTTFVFSYAVTKNCIITVLWLLPRHLFFWQFGLPSAFFLLNHAPGGMSLLIYMHSFSCIIHLHLPVVFCIGITGPLCRFRIFSHLSFSCKVFVIWAVFRIHWYFRDTSLIHPNFLLAFPVSLP